MAATHAFGILYLPVTDYKIFGPGTIQRAFEKREHILAREDHEDSPAALQKLHGARSTLINKEDQNQRRNAYTFTPGHPRACYIQNTVHNCTINTDALKRFAETPEALTIPTNKHGETYADGASYKRLALSWIPFPGWKGRGVTDLTYRHKGLGADLIAAGILSGSRVYADETTDPFRLPKKLRNLALGGNYVHDFDDEASHPRAAAHIIPGDQSIRQSFFDHRETIMSQIGNHIYAPMHP